jgi:RNA polymerase sigma factor (sigma-70 family)
MEVSKPEYQAWRADYDRKQYYRKRNHRHGFILVSLSDPSGDMKEKGLTIEDVTGSGTPGTWERAVEEMEVEELQQAISKLSQGDRELLKMRFWDSMTQQEIADATGLTKNYISSIERGVHKCNAQTFIIYAKKCGVSLDEMAGLIPKSKLNRKLLQKISEMSEDEQERALKILELMN